MDKRTKGLLAVTLIAASAMPAIIAAQEREPAATMSYRGAPWLERAEREREERPDEVLDRMGLEAGDVVADVGVGSGYFARRIARRIGDEGIVYGVDIQPEMLDILERNARDEGIDNIVPVLGGVADPKLPTGEIDWILLVDVYHELAEPAPMLQRFREALTPGGRVALLEYRMEDSSGDHIYPNHRMSVRQVLAEWEPAGFELVELHEFLPSQHMFILRPAGESAAEPGLAHLDLVEAVERGLVDVEVRGAGREQVGLRIRRRGDRRLLVTLPVGTLFRSRGEQRDMLARRDGARLLDDDGWLRWDVRAVGTSWDKQVPDDRDRFEVESVDPESRAARVAWAIQAGIFRIGPNAAAVDYTAQTVGVAEAAVWIALEDPGFADVADELGDRQIPARYAAGFGLVLCERAGIDIRSTRMWHDREAVFAGVDLPALRAWYSFRAG